MTRLLAESRITVTWGPAGFVLRCLACGVMRVLCHGEGPNDYPTEVRHHTMTNLQWFEGEHAHSRTNNVIRLTANEMIAAERKLISRKRSADDTGDIWKDGW